MFVFSLRRVNALAALGILACSSRLQSSAEVGAGLGDVDHFDCKPEHCTTPEERFLELAERFLHDQSARRAALIGSLLTRDNSYAQERLRAYGRDDGWDRLPVFAPEVAPVERLGTDVIGADWRSKESPLAQVLDSRWATADAANVEAWSLQQWVDFGEVAFFQFPAQRFPSVEALIGQGGSISEGMLDRLGLVTDESQRVGSLVSVRYEDGTTGLSFTCATCHSQVQVDGGRRAGAPSSVDVTAFSSGPVWGPGRVDVTSDGIDNPVAIADLRATRVQERLHHTGNLKNSLLGLAVRIETLLITQLNGAARPPREVAWALAVYIWKLGEDSVAELPSLEAARVAHSDGAAVFDARCRSCHVGPWGGGSWRPAEEVGTDPLVARSPARGTGGYRVPALVGFGTRPLSHEALSVPLEVWLAGELDGSASSPNPDFAPSSKESSSMGGRRGHAESTTGLALSEEELGALAGFLRAVFPDP